MENQTSPVTIAEKRTFPAPCAICAAPWVATPYGSKLEPHAPGCRYAGLILCGSCGHPSALMRPECKSKNHPTSESPLTATEVEAMREFFLDADCDAALRGLEKKRINPAKDWERPDGSLNHEPFIALVRELAELTPGARRRVIRSLVVWFEVAP